MKKKRALMIVVAAVAALTALAMFGCDKFDTSMPDLSDIYINYDATQGEIDTAELSLVLPDGWSVLSSASGANADSDIGYISSLNAFIVVNSAGDLSVVRVPEGDDKTVTEEDFLISPAVGVRAIKTVGSYFAVRISSSAGFVGVMDMNGNWRVNADKTSSSGVTVGSSTLSGAIRILDGELVAVNPAYVTDAAFPGNRNYTPIYRISTGELVCCIETGGTLDGVMGFDGEYVTVETSSTADGRETVIYRIPDTRPENAVITASRLASFTNTGDYDDYYTESLYLGGGKFYVHTEWTVDSSDVYTYSYDGEYYRAARYFYYPDTDEREQYTSAHIFLNAVNSYYDYATDRTVDGSTAVAPSSYLRDGYTYASFGLIIGADKEASYDQFILDGDLNIVYSLTTNFGIRPEGSLDREEVGLYDLMMQGSDGYYYARIYPSAIRLYTADGSLVFKNTEHTYVSASLQNGIVIAGIEDEDGDTVYGAFDLSGNNVIPFAYSSIMPFRSYYTYAVTAEGNTRVLLGKDGAAAPYEDGATAHFPDIATSSSNVALVQRGCYAFKTSTDDGTRYGVKNMSGDFGSNIVLDAVLSSCTLYSPSSDNSLVFVWGNRAEDGAYCVYALTSSSDGTAPAAEPEGLPDWGIGLIAAGCTLAAAGIVAGAVAAVRKSRGAKSASGAGESPRDKSEKK